MADLWDVLREHLLDHRTGWNMGSFGAVAEFHQDKGEYLEVDAPAMFVRATQRGAIRLNAEAIGQIVPVAYETLDPRMHRWSHGLGLCLPQKMVAMNGRTVLTELGVDGEAVRPADNNATLFDLGLDLPQCDFCIRTDDPELLAVLRANTGRSLFEAGNPASAAMMKAHPHRVALTRIGRIEVFERIGGPNTGRVSPAGVHTHLPQILKAQRTHSANIPIPKYHVALGYLHPANPVMDRMGRDRDFDIADHARFQGLFERFARRDLTILRKAVLDGLARRIDPEQFLIQPDFFSHATLRITLRQQYRLAQRFGGASYLDLVSRWRSVLDKGSDVSATDEDAPGRDDAEPATPDVTPTAAGRASAARFASAIA